MTLLQEIKNEKLGKISLLISRGISPNYIENDGFLVINQKCIRNNVINLDVARIYDKNQNVKKGCILKKGDILINSTGTGTLGRTAIVKEIKENLTVDSHVTIVRIDDFIADSIYIGYYIELLESVIENLAGGSTGQTELSRKDVANLDILLPPLPTQTRIAAILSAYDDLIEVNNQRIKLLEETARELYKEWFVRMRFPNYQAAKFVKGVPEGWEITNIGSVIKIKNGKEATLNDKGIYNVFGSNGQIGFSNKFNYENVLIIGRVGAYCGCVEIGLGKIWATDNTLVALPSFEIAGFYYSYYLLKILDMGNFASGSAQPLLTQSIINRLLIKMPSKEVIIKYESIVTPIYQQIENLQQQNTHLRQIRDRLLPRLISGKLQV